METRAFWSADGAVTTEQRLVVPVRLVEGSEAGAESLGSAYWRETERMTLGIVRMRERADGVDLSLLGAGPALLRFGRPRAIVGERFVELRYPIAGGVLALGPAGTLAVSQRGERPAEIRTTVSGFRPRLGAGPLYVRVQARLHEAIGRAFLRRVAEGL